MSKGLSKYIAAFDYFDKSIIISSATSDGISIASFATIIGAPIEIANASVSFAFSITKRIVKELLKQHGLKRKSIIILLR